MNYSYLFEFSKCAANLFGKNLHQRLGKAIMRGFDQTVKVSTLTKFGYNEAEASSIKDVFDFDCEIRNASLLTPNFIL